MSERCHDVISLGALAGVVAPCRQQEVGRVQGKISTRRLILHSGVLAREEREEHSGVLADDRSMCLRWLVGTAGAAGIIGEAERACRIGEAGASRIRET